MTRVAEVMTRGVRSMPPHATLVEAAKAMDELNVGAIPVCEGDRLIGMVTDRDIVVRAVAQGRSISETPLADVMSANVRSCFEDQSVDEVLSLMRDAQIRRVPVVDRARQLVGVLSLGDVAAKDDEAQAGLALEAISEPAEPDRSVSSEPTTKTSPSRGEDMGARDVTGAPLRD
ncbi:MAG TPA: CBS domain-containing protein [Burkholderiaceae bacterium]|nr:CBS domain-containing protein [Burkholderiaceae bacterium]